MPYRPRGVLPMQYGLPQLAPARQGMPMAPGSVTTGPAQEQRQGGGFGGLGDAASLYRMVKAQAKAPMNPMTSTYHGDMALQAVPGLGGYTPYNTAWAGDMAIGGVAPSGMGMVPESAAAFAPEAIEAIGAPGLLEAAGGAGAAEAGLLGAAGAEAGLLGATGAGVAPALGAAAPAVAEAALPAVAGEAAGLASLGVLGPIGLGLGGIFGLGKLMDWW